ncbi:MAG TPA: hypothetical protein VGD90_07115 [Sphingobacteriaceae bacterium]
MRNNLHFTIQQYLNGMLDPKAMHELEKEALEDDFLAEALEGYHTVKPSHAHMSLLQQQLQTRIAKHRVEKTAVSLSASRMSIAAVAGLVLILSGILFWMVSFEDLTTTTAPTTFIEASGSSAQPENGWSAYNQYLEDNIRPTNADRSGKIIMELSIGADRRPKDIRILNGLSDGQNAEAVRLVKDGPAWNISGSSPTVRITINFNK